MSASTPAPTSPIIIYEAAGQAVEVRLDANAQTVWLSLQQLADLFERDKSGISRHLNNIFKEGELDRTAVVAKNATTAADGNKRSAAFLFVDFLHRSAACLWQVGRPSSTMWAWPR